MNGESVVSHGVSSVATAERTGSQGAAIRHSGARCAIHDVHIESNNVYVRWLMYSMTSGNRESF